MNFIESVKERAKKDIKTIVLPEAEDIRVLEATAITLKEKFANIVLIGDEELIKIHFHTNTPWKVLEYCATLGDVYDVVVEATGSTSGFETSISLVKPRGTLILKSTIAANQGLNLAPVVVDEITIVGSRCGQFAPILRLLENKNLLSYCLYYL